LEYYQLAVMILFFSAIQSVLGVGLLLFGTPTLLLLGFSYPEVLWILLPCSCSISIIQILQGFTFVKTKSYVYYLTIPALICGLLLVIKLDYLIDIKKLVGVFLILAAFLRIFDSPYVYGILANEKFKKISYLLIGFVHGLSNLGGALLTVVASASFKDKESIRANIAFVYFALAVSQLIVLGIYNREMFDVANLIFIPFIIVNHFFLQRFLISSLNDRSFNIFVSLIVLTFGLLCIF
jgi:uncharacterized protein